MKKEEEKKAQVWLVMTGFACNSNCVMCSVRPKAKNYSDRLMEDIVVDLKKGINLGYNRVDFTGGEPAIRSDIFDLVKIAKSLGYKKIGIDTNARIFSYEGFCRKIVENGLNWVTFTVNGHNERLVDAMARTPNTFKQVVAGIKNIMRYPGIEVSANTVVSSLNYKYLQEVGNFILSFGIDSWHLLDLIPDGNAKDFYKSLSVRMSDLSNCFESLDGVIDRFKSVMFFDFPLCIFPSRFLQNPKNIFITAKGRMEIAKQVGYNPKRFKESAGGFFEDIHKKKTEACSKCKFSNACGGVWEDYLKLYGEEETGYSAKKNGCLVSSEEGTVGREASRKLREKDGEEVHAYLQIEATCNQKCLFCNRPPTKIHKKCENQDISIIKKRIDDLGKNSKIKRIIFTGGEPTLNSNLPDLISYAKSYGFKVEIQTNGTVLNEDKLKTLKASGLDIINFALHSHKEKISNKLRGVVFGYKRIIENIKLAKDLGFEIHAIHVINNFNYKDLSSFIDFIHERKLDDLYLNLSIVVPEGWAWENKEVIPRMRDIKPHLQLAMKKCKKYGIRFDVSEIVPLCIMQGFEEHAVSSTFKLSKMKIMDDYFTSQRFLDFENPSSVYAKKAPQCKECTFDKICAGFYPRLAEIYGTEDFIPRKDDPALVFADMRKEKLLDEFSNKNVEIFHHKKSRSPKIIYVNLDEKCNQNCVFCVVKGANKNKFGSMSNGEARRIIGGFIKNGGTTIIFTGGEPTLREDLPELIEYAEQLPGLGGISVITNGVRLANKEYFKRIIDSDKFNKLGFSVSLHSHKRAVSDLLTRAPGSFDKTILGIKNAIRSGRRVSIYHVITSKNYKDLSFFSKFLIKNFPEIKDITLAYPFPQGNAVLNEWINVKMDSLRPHLKACMGLFEKNGYNISIAACGQFPLCAIPGFEENILQPLDFSEENISGVVGEKAFHEFEMATEEWVSQYKGKNEKCEKCILNNICQGFWKKYVEMFGFSGIAPVDENNFSGEKVILRDKEDFKKFEKGLNRKKLNLIIMGKDYLKEVKYLIKINKLLAIVIYRGKVVYPK